MKVISDILTSGYLANILCDQFHFTVLGVVWCEWALLGAALVYKLLKQCMHGLVPNDTNSHTSLFGTYRA